VSQSPAIHQPVGASVPRRSGLAAARPALLIAALAGLFGGLAGCEVDSYLDPSVIGRWENTPTIVPVLERIDIVERDTGEFVDVTPVLPSDLLPEITEYRVAAGDSLVVSILDFIESGRESRFELVVDPRGFVPIPQIGEIFVNKRSRQEIERDIVEAVRARGILEDPLVDVQIPGTRQATFSIFGVVDRAGRYLVPGPEYRLLEAITDAGGLPPSVDKLYIIRQVTLTESGDPVNLVDPVRSTPSQPTRPPVATPPAEGVDLQDLINELTAPADEVEGQPAQPEGQTPPPAAQPGEPVLEDIPAAEEPAKPADAPSLNVAPTRRPAARSGRTPATRIAAAPSVMMQQDTAAAPPIDLPDDAQPILPINQPVASQASGGLPGVVPARGKWTFINGEWVNVVSTQTVAAGLPEGADPLAGSSAQEVITQRVIEVPVAPLVQGVAQYNLVVRAGDVISVPGPRQGFVYLGGPGASRPGVYQLPFTGKLTLQRLIMASGGLSSIAIPERVDITRMVGDDRQATVRLNLRAIAEGTQPDLFLKPDDMINVGTNFWALPLAIIRGGMRASYGFGFLLDRNFGNDVFGAPPENRSF
jgi:polysaccharide biosynthesis/export protein